MQTDMGRAKELLKNTYKTILRDHFFGDREIYWKDDKGNTVASGYAGGSSFEIYVEFPDGEVTFKDWEADELDAVPCKSKKVERNDTTGDDT